MRLIGLAVVLTVVSLSLVPLPAKAQTSGHGLSDRYSGNCGVRDAGTSARLVSERLLLATVKTVLTTTKV
jgi:hypothetical protein